MYLREHRHNLKDGFLEKSKLAQHAYTTFAECIDTDCKLKRNLKNNFPLISMYWFPSTWLVG
jgi:hypothetical protein